MQQMEEAADQKAQAAIREAEAAHKGQDAFGWICTVEEMQQMESSRSSSSGGLRTEKQLERLRKRRMIEKYDPEEFFLLAS